MTWLALSAVVLGLAWFAAINAIVSVMVWAALTRASRATAPLPAGVLVTLRLLPAAASLVFAAAVFLPAHWRFEPFDAAESFGLVLYGLAAAAAALLGRSVWRACGVMRAGRRLRDATTCLSPLAHCGAVLAAYEVRGWSGVSLAGLLRPRILVGDGAREVLSRAELDVALAHEVAHRRALDNVKRFAMFCAPDLLHGPTAARLEERWRSAAEWEADDRAVAGDRARALDLASALVKIARIGGASSNAMYSPAWSSLHEGALLEQRVRRLVADAPSGRAVSPPLSRLTLVAVSAIGVVACAVAAPHAVHRLTEALVRWLP